MDTEESTNNHKKALTPEQLEQKRSALKKAVERKKELGMIKKVEQEKKKLDDDDKISIAKQQMEEIEKRKKAKIPLEKIIRAIIKSSPQACDFFLNFIFLISILQI